MRTWAEFADRDPSQAEDRLSRWLEGRSLQVYDDREPFEELFLLAVAQRETEQLARVTAQLAQHWAAGNWKSTPKSRFNLLRLATELQDRRQMAEPIWALYRQRAVEVGSAYHGFLLTRELRGAMTYNHPVGPLSPLWWQLLCGKPDAYIQGDAADGFHGVLRSGCGAPQVAAALRQFYITTRDRERCRQLRLQAAKVLPDLAPQIANSARIEELAEYLVRLDVSTAKVIDGHPLLHSLGIPAYQELLDRCHLLLQQTKARVVARLLECADGATDNLPSTPEEDYGLLEMSFPRPTTDADRVLRVTVLENVGRQCPGSFYNSERSEQLANALEA